MKAVDGVPVKGWLYRDDLRIVAELDGAGAVVSRFVYADGAGVEEGAIRTVLTRLGLGFGSGGSGGAHVPAYMVRGGIVYRILTDHLGTPRLVVDAATGTVAQRFDVDEWGNVIQDTNPGFTPFGFAAGLYDPDTGLVRFGARDYDAVTGRWTAKDPIGFEGDSENLFEYAANDPLNYIDETGTRSLRPGPVPVRIPPGAGLAAGVGGAAVGAYLYYQAGQDVCRIPGEEPPVPANDNGSGSGWSDPPEDPPSDGDDCAQRCSKYLGRGGSYRGSNGHTYRNDLGGQHAFQRCVAECRGRTID